MSPNYVCCFLVLATAFLLAGAYPVYGPSQLTESPDEQFIREMLNGYKDALEESDPRNIIETVARMNTKYRAMKRNADLINALLALPRGLNEAGR